MYYEEKVVDGVIWFRNHPDGEWNVLHNPESRPEHPRDLVDTAVHNYIITKAQLSALMHDVDICYDAAVLSPENAITFLERIKENAKRLNKDHTYAYERYKALINMNLVEDVTPSFGCSSSECNWVSGDNEVVTGIEVCTNCHKVRW